MNSPNIIQRLMSDLSTLVGYLLRPVLNLVNIAIGYVHAARLVADAYHDCGVSHYLIGAPPSAHELPQIHPTPWATQPGATPSVRVSLSYLTGNTERFAESTREFLAYGTSLVYPRPVASSSTMVDEFLQILLKNQITALVPEMARQLLQERSGWDSSTIYICKNRAMSRATVIALANGIDVQLYRIAYHVIETNEPAVLVYTPGWWRPFRLWRLSCKHVIGPTIINPDRP